MRAPYPTAPRAACHRGPEAAAAFDGLRRAPSATITAAEESRGEPMPPASVSGREPVARDGSRGSRRAVSSPVAPAPP